MSKEALNDPYWACPRLDGWLARTNLEYEGESVAALGEILRAW